MEPDIFRRAMGPCLSMAALLPSNLPFHSASLQAALKLEGGGVSLPLREPESLGHGGPE